MNLNIVKISFFQCLLCLFFSSPINLIAQVNHQNPINNYISFANESTHGMLIAHRILEGFNQKVNAYVDLQSNQFNFYGNKDLPKDIFEDPEHWFYPISPNTWYNITKETTWDSPHRAELDKLASKMQIIYQRVNSIRFTMEEFMLNNDLSLVENQVDIFSQLENCASLYDRFYEVNDQLHTLTNQIAAQDTQGSEMRNGYAELQKALKGSLEKIRYGFDNELKEDLEILIQGKNRLQNQASRTREDRDLKAALNEGIDIIEAYLANNPIPEKYKLYGPAYYYHNVELAAIINRYGKGFVANANKLILAEDPENITLLEEPHYFKVILPRKEIPLEESRNIITTLPSKLEEREVAISQQTIKVNQKKLLLEIFDHRQEDGDIISLNFNGHWILEKRKLKKSPLKLVVELNDIGENYLILHAENLGEIPPNTIAVRYYLDGVRKIVVLNSDLNQSEMIRINRIAVTENDTENK